ncbi:hypothetical protein [Citreimonas salinaria]|uniref:hypothetical protein n=1 Tax=Citreimonas salinaria TaxID=321339 RepID=UPI00115FAE50|nr:hypothetical protein [Citreimonas salinaria]
MPNQECRRNSHNQANGVGGEVGPLCSSTDQGLKEFHQSPRSQRHCAKKAPAGWECDDDQEADQTEAHRVQAPPRNRDKLAEDLAGQKCPDPKKKRQQGSGRDGHPSKPIHPRYVLPQAEGRKARNQKLCCA